MTIYLGNIAYDTTEEQVHALISPYGTVFDLNYPTDAVTGKKRGFAFVTIPDLETAQKAIMTLNGQEVGGRPLRVSEASQKDQGQDRGIPVGFRKAGDNPFQARGGFRR